jgi:CHAT domain-containing protein
VLASDLSRVELVVLAACWSTEAAVLPGNELVCFPAAFLDAGAGAVLGSLWEIPDAASCEFQDGFYGEATKTSPARALAAIQSRWAAEGRPVFEWASYQLFGVS